METLRDHGRPNFRAAYQRIVKTSVKDPHTIRFDFADGTDRELPLIIAFMPVLPAHAFDLQKFQSTFLDPPIGSGPYQVISLDQGSQMTFSRNPDYWGKDKPFAVGHDNFDQIKLEYFRDKGTLFESFKKGLIDVLPETDPAFWAQDYPYTHPEKGHVIKAELNNGLPQNAAGFVFNMRRDIFRDKEVRKALSLMFDFQWVNDNLYHGLYHARADFLTVLIYRL
jgi:peptide/nickel transport system substrate-binding protein